MSRLLILGIGFLLASCSKEEISPSSTCIDGDCNGRFYIDELVQPNAYQDDNGYWHIEHWGPNYFTIRGELDELNEEYEVNEVPIIETHYDSDYWIAFDSLSFTIPTYSVLSWFTDGEFNNPVPVGTMTYTLTDIVQIQAPLNIAGYQINRNFSFFILYSN